MNLVLLKLKNEIVLDKNNNIKGFSGTLKKISSFIEEFPDKAKKLKSMIAISSFLQDFVYETTLDCFETEQVLEEEDWQATLETLEKLIMRSLYNKVITLVGTDTKLNLLIKQYHVLSLEDFGVSLSFNQKIDLSRQINVFNKVSEVTTPKEKLNLLEGLYKYLVKSYEPKICKKLIIFSIINSSINNFKSHLRFCSLFRNKTLITPQEEIILETFFNCLSIIENLSTNFAEILVISQKKFEELKENFEKENLFNSIKFSDGHFVQNTFIEDRLLSLVNSKNYELAEAEVPSLGSTKLDENTVRVIKEFYLSKDCSRIPLKNLRELKDKFGQLLDIAEKVQKRASSTNKN